MKRKKKKKKSDAVANNQSGENSEPIEGPGYMGWGVDDKTGEYDKTQDYKSKLEKVKDSYDNLKSEFDELKTAFKQMEKKLEEKNVDAKSIKKLDSEIIKLKQDYKDCIEAVKTETIARTKAETMAKVLKETLDIQAAMKDVDHGADDNMATGDEGELKQTKKKQKMKSKEMQD